MSGPYATKDHPSAIRVPNGDEDSLSRRKPPRLQKQQHLPCARVGTTFGEDYKQAADIHFLNSLEGGQACLLVDSYEDLADGVALAEAFSLVEGFPRTISFKPGHTVDYLRRALAAVKARRGPSAVPSKLFQPAFLLQVRQGEAGACGSVVTFLRRLHEINTSNGTSNDVEDSGGGCSRTGVCASRSSGSSSSSETQSFGSRSVGGSVARRHKNTTDGNDKKVVGQRRIDGGKDNQPAFASTNSPTEGRTGWTAEQKCRTKGKPPTSNPASPSLRRRNATARVGTRRRAKGTSLDRASRRQPPPPTPPPSQPVPPPPVPFPQSRGTTRDRASGYASGSDKHMPRETKRAGRRWGTATSSASEGKGPQPSTAVAAAAAFTASIAPGSGGDDCCRAIAHPTESVLVRKRHVSWALPTGNGRRADVAEAVEAGAKGSVAFNLHAEGGRHVLSGDNRKNKDEPAEMVVHGKGPGEGAGNSAADAGRRRAERRNILRWMDSLGVKVDWSLLTPEEAPCHERFSSGELLCELAAAVDYSVSGGRGLPLSEIPGCPGRFVLRGTCRGPPTSARRKHNVHAALSAFGALGGVGGTWLRGGEAVLEGDHKATWGLLGDVYRQYGGGHVRSTHANLRGSRPQPQKRPPKRSPHERTQGQRQAQQQQQPLNRSPIVSTPPQKQGLAPSSPGRQVPHHYYVTIEPGDGAHRLHASDPTATSAPDNPPSMVSRQVLTPAWTNDGKSRSVRRVAVQTLSGGHWPLAGAPASRTGGGTLANFRACTSLSQSAPPPKGHHGAADTSPVPMVSSGGAGAQRKKWDKTAGSPGSGGAVVPAACSPPVAVDASATQLPLKHSVEGIREGGAPPCSGGGGCCNHRRATASDNRPPEGILGDAMRGEEARSLLSSRPSGWRADQCIGVTGTACPEEAAAAAGARAGEGGGGGGGASAREKEIGSLEGAHSNKITRESAREILVPEKMKAAALYPAAGEGCLASVKAQLGGRSCGEAGAESGLTNVLHTAPRSSSLPVAVPTTHSSIRKECVFCAQTSRVATDTWVGADAGVVKEQVLEGTIQGGSLTSGSEMFAAVPDLEHAAGVRGKVAGAIKSSSFRGSCCENIADAGVKISPSQEGERASTETTKWLRWEPFLPAPSSAMATSRFADDTLVGDNGGGDIPCRQGDRTWSKGAPGNSSCCHRSPSLVEHGGAGAGAGADGGTGADGGAGVSAGVHGVVATSCAWFQAAKPERTEAESIRAVPLADSTGDPTLPCGGAGFSKISSSPGGGKILPPLAPVDGAHSTPAAVDTRRARVSAGRSSHAASSGGSGLCPSGNPAVGRPVSFSDFSFRTAGVGTTGGGKAENNYSLSSEVTGSGVVPESRQRSTCPGSPSGAVGRGFCQAERSLFPHGKAFQPPILPSSSSPGGASGHQPSPRSLAETPPCSETVSCGNDVKGSPSSLFLRSLAGDDDDALLVPGNNGSTAAAAAAAATVGFSPHHYAPKMTIALEDPFTRSAAADLLPVPHQNIVVFPCK